MTTYIALLRGINVGGRLIKMADLKPCVEKLGFRHVATVLQTGNIVLQSDLDEAAVRRKLEQGIGAAFGLEASALVYTTEQLVDIIDAYPFDSSDTARHDYVIFMDNDAAERLIALAPETDPANEQIALGEGVIYWNVTKGMTLDSVFAKQIAKVTRQSVTTTRNMNTVRKILLKAAAI